MEPYDPFNAIDEFAAEISAFGCLQGDLVDPATARLRITRRRSGAVSCCVCYSRAISTCGPDGNANNPATAVVATGADGLVRPYRETGHQNAS
jgi:hypothetical protein